MPDYRDELTAAHSRIAELEDKVAALEEGASRETALAMQHGVAEARFQELEADVERRRKDADPARAASLRLKFSVAGIVLALTGAGFSMAHLPLGSIFASGLFIFCILAGFLATAKLPENKRALLEAERRLADARSLARLEAQVQTMAAAPGERLRVEASAPPDEERERPDDELENEPPPGRKRA